MPSQRNQRSKPIFFAKQNSQKQAQRASSKSYFKSIFVLTLILVVFQSLTMILYANYAVNIILFGFIMSIYVNKAFSQIMLKFILLVNLFSILMDFGFIYVHFQDIFSHKFSNLIEQRAVLKIDSIFPQFLTILTAIIFLTFIGKLLLSIFIAMELLQKSNSSKEFSLFSHKIQLKCLQNQQSGLLIHQTLVKSFIN